MAIEAIDGHMTRGDLRDGLVFDAVRVRLIEIGEAVKGIDTDHAILESTVDRDLPMLLEAVGRLMRLIELES